MAIITCFLLKDQRQGLLLEKKAESHGAVLYKHKMKGNTSKCINEDMVLTCQQDAESLREN